MHLFKARLWFTRQREIMIPFILITGTFFCGIISGALTLRVLNPVQLEELRQYLDSFIQWIEMLSGESIHLSWGLKVWSEVVQTQLVTFGLLWLLGLTVIGIPLIILAVGARGFILGFTVGFLVQERAGQGLILALAAVLPQNLFYVPALLGAGIFAFYFSFSLMRGFRENSPLTSILVYSLIFVLTFFVVLIGTWIETYFVPRAVRLTIFFT